MSKAILAVDWEPGVQEAWSDVVVFAPRLLACLVILVIGFIVATVAQKITRNILERVHFGRLVDRGGVARLLAPVSFDAAAILARIVFWAVILIAVEMAFAVFGPNPVSSVINSVIGYLPNLFIAIVIVIVAAALAVFVKDLINARFEGSDLVRPVAVASAIVIMTVGVFAALNQLGIAHEIVIGLFYALLVIVAGSAVIAIGGGGIGPMRQVWERSLHRYETERTQVRVRPSPPEPTGNAHADSDSDSDSGGRRRTEDHLNALGARESDRDDAGLHAPEPAAPVASVRSPRQGTGSANGVTVYPGRASSPASPAAGSGRRPAPDRSTPDPYAARPVIPESVIGDGSTIIAASEPTTRLPPVDDAESPRR